jgi:hypothetical protein
MCIHEQFNKPMCLAVRPHVFSARCAHSIAAGNPWENTNTVPRCRIEIGTDAMPLDLDRRRAGSLVACIKICHTDVNCQAVTFRYDVTDNSTDNCWLKTATTATRRIDEPPNKVTVVSVFKPSYNSVAHKKKNLTCEQVKEELMKCALPLVSARDSAGCCAARHVASSVLDLLHSNSLRLLLQAVKS